MPNNRDLFEAAMRAKGWKKGSDGGWAQALGAVPVKQGVPVSKPQETLPVDDPRDTVKLILPYPVSVNRYMGQDRKTGRRFIYQESKDYMAEVKRIAAPMVPQIFQGDVDFSMFLYRPRRVGDATNFSKQLCDALEGVLYVNDKQIRDFHAHRRDDASNPRVEVFCKPIST